MNSPRVAIIAQFSRFLVSIPPPRNMYLQFTVDPELAFHFYLKLET